MESSTYYFHMKSNIMADFQISISVPLTAKSNNLSFILRQMLPLH